MPGTPIRIFLPSLLAHCADGERQVEVIASTLDECLKELTNRFPLLAVHLFDESHKLRAHVNVFHNDTNVKWLDDWHLPLSDGDTLTVLQAVSGG